MEKKYDIIAISVLFGPAYKSMLDLGNICKKNYKIASILGGGFLSTNMYNQIFKDSNCFNALCFGEGKKALTRFIKVKNKRKFLANDQTWITKNKININSNAGYGFLDIGKKEKKIKEFKQDLFEKLDEIPFLDYTIGDLSGYKINPTVNAYPQLKKYGQPFHIMTSRGCVYSSSFCAQDTVHGKLMR